MLFFSLLIGGWLIALLWVWRTLVALRYLPSIPDLLDARYAQPMPDMQQITVIVPGRNEEQGVEDCLRTLLDIDSVQLEILAVNDRSTESGLFPAGSG